MHKGAMKLLVSAVILFATVSAPATAQRKVENAGDLWVHQGTGTTFPEDIAGFSRRDVIEYSDDGMDAGVTYRLAEAGRDLTVSIYVYPAVKDWNCGEIFEDAKTHIARYSGARLLLEQRALAPGGEGGRSARFARYFIPAGRITERAPDVHSDLYLHCPKGGKWLAKYRATGNAGREFSLDVSRLVEAIVWPKELAR